MITFFIGLAILIVGAFFYGKLCERVFGPDDRKTPAYTKEDGVDYVPMSTWKNSLINLLNIAGTGPILGPIQGILFGPLAFITIPIGNIIGGAMHDYFAGMICLRDGGLQMPNMIKKYSNKGVYVIYQVFVCLLLLLVGAVFIYTPGDIAAAEITSKLQLSPTTATTVTWVIYGVIFLYYLLATVFPIDKIIGKIYPIFGGILMFSAVGIFISMLVQGVPLAELWGSWDSPLAYILDESGAKIPFLTTGYFGQQKFFPVFFVTVACGILSGFHSTQTSIVSRTTQKEKQGKTVFYYMMVLEGFIAMVWAAAAMAAYNSGWIASDPNKATGAITEICKHLLGTGGGIIALLGVIVLPITSGDTALRSLRLAIAESFRIKQEKNGQRLALSGVIFALVAGLLVFAKLNKNGFSLLWRYFAWSNQVLALFAFLAITVWMFENGKGRFVWMPAIPGAFYAFVTTAYIVNAKIGFGQSWTVSYIVGAVICAAYLAALILYGNKRGKKTRLQ